MDEAVESSALQIEEAVESNEHLQYKEMEFEHLYLQSCEGHQALQKVEVMDSRFIH